ncbi:28244_t:CDS:2 [Gigaspora margarita]|uniref:28244_t:CDS:1 n=1 Tax=Gigaspora margarita TaxID=4874 RepID=A0ABN7VMI0_GIGMA|nr:28244_t:CDS:2 [Gigaspora margarita]
MLTCHLQNRKFPYQPQVISTTNPTPIPQIDSEAEPQEIIISQKEYEFLKAQKLIEDKENKNTIDLDKYLSREEFEFLKTLDSIENDALLDTELVIQKDLMIILIY